MREIHAMSLTPACGKILAPKSNMTFTEMVIVMSVIISF